MSYLELSDGARIYYETFGKGSPAIVFLHGGLGFDSSYLRNAFLPLADSGIKLVFLDFRGNGKSSRRPADLEFTFASLSEDVEELREKLNLGQIVLFGHSLSGVTAQEYAARYSGQLAGLILDNTFIKFGAEVFAEIERRVASDNLKILLEAFGSPFGDDEAFAKAAEAVLPPYFYKFDQEKAKGFFSETKFSAVAYNRSSELSGSVNTIEILPQITAPTLITAGKHDLFGTAKIAETMRERIPNARLVIFEQSGHYAFWEEREKYLQTIKDFIAGISK